MTQTSQTTRIEFIEGLGIAAQEEGMSRISGRIMGLLMFDGGMFSFSDIANELQVSRGSISTNVRMLINRGVIRRAAKPGERLDYFTFADNPYDTLMAGFSQRAHETAKWLKKIAVRLDNDDPARLERLNKHAAFYDNISAGFKPQ